jgi:hypothetical protein
MRLSGRGKQRYQSYYTGEAVKIFAIFLMEEIP